MKPIKISRIEYQGIKIIKKDYEKLQKALSDCFPQEKLKLKPNPHICISYFGAKRKIDAAIEKENALFPRNVLGLQVQCECTGIGVYYKDGKIMNIAACVNDDIFYETKIGERLLEEYNTNGMPWITLYVCPDTEVLEDGKEHPVTSCKKSIKCFDEKHLEAGETMEIFPLKEPVMVTGELCAFSRNMPIYRVEQDAPRLVTRKAIKTVMDDLCETDFETIATEIRQAEKEAKKKAAESQIFG